jgi:hypothetical protein
MKFMVSEKIGPHGRILIITDFDIIGKKFEQNNTQLDLTQKFYQGTQKTEDDVKKIIKNYQHLHLTGKAAVALGISLGLIEHTKILYVNKVPHAEMVVGT